MPYRTPGNANWKRGHLFGDKSIALTISQDLNAEDVQVTYNNVLPSNLRHGNLNVMPLMPPKLDNWR